MKLNSYDNLVQATAAFAERGFSGQFKYIDNQLVHLETDSSYRADQLQIVEYHRFEGATNPSDMSVIFGIETDDGMKGTLIMAYSADADMDLLSFIDKVKIKTPEHSSNQQI